MLMKAFKLLLPVFLFSILVAQWDGKIFPERLLSVLRKPNQFTYFNILNTATHLTGGFHTRLLVFDGEDFGVYNLDKKGQLYIEPRCARCGQIVPLLVHSLKEQYPDRFQKGKPVFQLMFSTGDSVHTDCVDGEEGCDINSPAPVMLFGSAPSDSKEMPNVRALPNWFYISCLYDYKMKGENKCHWAEPVHDVLPFDTLEPTIIWRGSDFCFLPDHPEFKIKGPESIDLSHVWNKEDAALTLMGHWPDLPPRWRAVALTSLAELNNETWIDAKFTSHSNAELHEKFAYRGLDVRATKPMTATEMGKYKYQIDFGGGGGTSWRGTLTKLSLPGVLFHHETPNKDWFYDEMQPWVHYIPVAWHLGDLKANYMWAMSHEDAVRDIAKKASELFEYFMSEKYMKKVYDELFVEYLDQVMKAHIDPEVPWGEIRKAYEEAGFQLELVGVCDSQSCTSFGDLDTKAIFSVQPEAS